MPERDVVFATPGQIEMARVHVKASRMLGEQPDPFTMQIADATAVASNAQQGALSHHGNGTTAIDVGEVGYVTPGQIELAKVHVKASRLLGEEPDAQTARIANA